MNSTPTGQKTFPLDFPAHGERGSLFAVWIMRMRGIRMPIGFSGSPAAAKAGGDRFELLLGDVRIRWQREMHRLHVALMDLDLH